MHAFEELLVHLGRQLLKLTDCLSEPDPANRVTGPSVRGSATLYSQPPDPLPMIQYAPYAP
jgi:hypothetical protein